MRALIHASLIVSALAQPAFAQEEARMLPFLGEEARKLGHELPEPFGVGFVYANLGSSADVDNVNVKLDAWLLPFLNVYGIVGKIKNKSDTHLEVTLPPLL